MTIERRESHGERGYRVVLTRCAYCGRFVKENVGYAQHLPNCPSTPIAPEPPNDPKLPSAVRRVRS